LHRGLSRGLIQTCAESVARGHGDQIWGHNHGEYFGFDGMGGVWLCTLGLAVALYPVVKAFAAFKARRRDLAWLKYL